MAGHRTYQVSPGEVPQMPPWHVLSSREVARFLNVSLQTLANWRVRDVGPEAEPFEAFKGNRCFYRLDKVLAWLNGERERWEFCADYLANENHPREGFDEERTWGMVRYLEKSRALKRRHRPRRPTEFGNSSGKRGASYPIMG